MGVFTYSHEENTSAHVLEDDVADELKKARQEEIMDLQTHISWELNQEKIGKLLKYCSTVRKEITLLGVQSLIHLMSIMRVLVKAN